MQFQVPQFIEVEDKVVGPLTIKQFVYLAGGAGLSGTLYILVKPFFLAVILMAPIIALSVALAFLKINNKPFIATVEAAFFFSLNKKLYIWKKREKAPTPKEKRGEEDDPTLGGLLTPRLSDSKLKDLAWSLDINEKVRRG